MIEKCPLSVLEAAVSLAVEHGRIARNTELRNSVAWTEVLEKRRIFSDYVRGFCSCPEDQNLIEKAISRATALIPEIAYGSVLPEACKPAAPETTETP